MMDWTAQCTLLLQVPYTSSKFDCSRSSVCLCVLRKGVCQKTILRSWVFLPTMAVSGMSHVAFRFDSKLCTLSSWVVLPAQFIWFLHSCLKYNKRLVFSYTLFTQSSQVCIKGWEIHIVHCLNSAHTSINCK